VPGTTLPGYMLDVSGDINTTTGYRLNGTAGATTTCSGGRTPEYGCPGWYRHWRYLCRKQRRRCHPSLQASTLPAAPTLVTSISVVRYRCHIAGTSTSVQRLCSMLPVPETPQHRYRYCERHQYSSKIRVSQLQSTALVVGQTSTFNGNVTFANAHLKVTRPPPRTIGTPTNCGTSLSAAKLRPARPTNAGSRSRLRPPAHNL